jgi:hypothetical protein
LPSMRLPNRITSHQKKRTIEVRYDLDQSASPVRRLENLRVQKMEFAPPQEPHRLNSDRKESPSMWL